MTIFELYDVTIGDHISYHKTIEGAVIAMSKAVEKLAKALDHDYEGDPSVDFELRYRVIKHVVKD